MKKLISLTAVIMAFFFVTLNVIGEDKKPADPQPAKEISVADMKNMTAVMTTNFGVIKIQFYPDEAPGTCRNFITLVNKKFYDGLTFHRIIKNFMIQGGCPTGNGTGGPGYSIKAEFNKIKHVPGTVSMARSNDPDSAGSQFFICQGQASDFLDGKYTAFAHVVEGQDVVDKITDTKLNGEAPVEKVVIISVVIEQKASQPADKKEGAPGQNKPADKKEEAPADKKPAEKKEAAPAEKKPAEKK